MKKWLTTLLLIIIVLLLILTFISGLNSTTKTSNYSINYTWTDESKKYVSDLNFSFNSIRDEKAVANVFLNESSVIQISNYQSEKDCIIKIIDKSNNIVNEYTIKQNFSIENCVSKSGDYNLVLYFKQGKGEGKISIINN